MAINPLRLAALRKRAIQSPAAMAISELAGQQA